MALDLGSRAGFAEGVAGEMPKLGAVVLKRPADSAETAAKNLACFLRDCFVLDRPDLLVVEQYMYPSAQSGGAAQVVSLMLHGAMHAVAGCYGVSTVAAHPSKIRAHFCGQARANIARRAKDAPPKTSREKREDREATKRMVWERAIALGYLRREAGHDFDRADAASIFDYGAVVLAKVQRPTFALFGQQPQVAA